MKVTKKMKVLSLIFIITFLVLLILFFNNSKLLLKNNFEKNKLEQSGMTYEIYSYKDNKGYALLQFYEEQGIEEIIYPNQNNTIYVNGRTTFSIDYNIELDKEYNFIIKTSNNETINRNLQITQQDIENLISIKVDSETSFGTEATLEIDFSAFYMKQYRIGNTGNYTDYQNDMVLSSYTIINNKNGLNEDGTLTIYAQGIDEAGNTVEVSKIVDCLDFDIPIVPTITVVQAADYPILTSNGVKLDSTIKISYDSRTDVTNYYSLDNGTTWQVYTGNFETTSVLVKAKCVKNVSGLMAQSNIFVSPSASDALKVQAYDGNLNTSVVGKVTQYIKVDESAYNKLFEMTYISTYINIRDGKYGVPIYINFLDENKSSIKNYTISDYGVKEDTVLTKKYNIESDSKWIKYTGNVYPHYSGHDYHSQLKEISIVDNN